MALYFIGLGLYDEKDVTIRGLETIKSCKTVYLEHYTSVLHTSIENLEKFYGKKIIIADRDMVEKNADMIIDDAKAHDVGFLVAGDPMCATTHVDLMLRAREKGIKVTIIHNASAISAVGATGLEVYKFGKVTSITFSESGFMPQTCYDVLKQNQQNNFHTLMLLDIKVKEQKKDDMIKGKNEYQKPRFMTVNQGIQYLFDIEKKRKEKVFDENTIVVGCARLGALDQKIISGTAKKLLTVDFGSELHLLIVPAKNLHFIEEEALDIWKLK